jgi:long-chain acyl-CoA synthetase
VLEGYGLTETSGAATVNTPQRVKFGTVGQAIPDVQIRIEADGEVLIRGRNVMREYWGKPEDTREALDAEGFLHTGDVGRLDEDGFLTITDRKKDMIVTAGGKNVAPQRIEAQLEQSRMVSHAIVLGDRRPHLVALLTLDEEVVRAWAKEEGLSGEWSALARHPKVRDRVAADVDDVNARLASYERVRRFAILDKELRTSSGELTPTLKVKRRVVAERHAEAIAELYDS